MIYCCKNCVAPKRHTACWDNCPEYLAEKEAHNKRKAELDSQRQLSGAISADRSYKVYKAYKAHKKI